MLNLIKMDMRRLIKSKSFYLAMTIFIIFSVYCVYSQAKWQVINGYPYVENLHLDVGLYSIIDYYLKTPLQFMFSFTLKNGLIIFGIFFISFIASDDQSGYVKNLCMMCENKSIIVLSKLCLAIMISTIVLILSFILTTVMGYMRVNDFHMGNVQDLAVFMMTAIMFMIAYFSMLTTLYHLVKSKVPSIILSILFPLGITLGLVAPILNDYTKYSLSGVFIHFSMQYEAKGTMLTIVMCVIYIIIYQVISMFIFSKRDI